MKLIFAGQCCARAIYAKALCYPSICQKSLFYQNG